MRIGTAVTASHLPWARVLATSFAEHHPDAPPVAVLVVDDVADAIDATGEPFTLLRPADVGIDREELHRRGAMYEPMELAGSTRALLLQELLTRAVASRSRSSTPTCWCAVRWNPSPRRSGLPGSS
jgi:hypothetical protein